MIRASRQICVCVPARNEAERLPLLLKSLGEQDFAGRFSVLLALNNTTDGSSDILEGLRAEHAGTFELHIDDHVFAPDRAHAGSARRRALELGAAIVDGADDAILLTTDADARPPADWVRNTIEAIERGADLVGGALALDEDEPVPPLVAARWRLLTNYWARVRAVEDAIDPVAWDPAPRHGDNTGGSLATTVAAWRAAGGVPAIPLGEDVAFVNAARRAGFRLAHPIGVSVRVSPRTRARAEGGMAATMVALGQADSGALTLPSLDQWRERAEWRRRTRAVSGDAGVAAQEGALPPLVCDFRLEDGFAEAAE